MQQWKKTCTAILCLLTGVCSFPLPCSARDFIVRFVEENYKETRAAFSYEPVIYHSIQVTSAAGPKLLVLEGDNYHYRTWLRQYISKDSAFVLKVPENDADRFLTAGVFKTDIKNIHPLNLPRYLKSLEKNKTAPDRIEEINRLTKKSSKKSDEKRQAELDAKAEQERREKEAKTRQQKSQDAQKLLEDEKKRHLAMEAAARDRQKAIDARAESRRIADQAELEKRLKEQADFLAQLAEQKAREQADREKEIEARWQELRQRLMQDDRIRKMDQAEREQEIQRRWQELRLRVGTF